MAGALQLKNGGTVHWLKLPTIVLCRKGSRREDLFDVFKTRQQPAIKALMEGYWMILSNLVEHGPWIRLIISGHDIWSSHDIFPRFLLSRDRRPPIRQIGGLRQRLTAGAL